jgi:hypothetical protein
MRRPRMFHWVSEFHISQTTREIWAEFGKKLREEPIFTGHHICFILFPNVLYPRPIPVSRTGNVGSDPTTVLESFGYHFASHEIRGWNMLLLHQWKIVFRLYKSGSSFSILLPCFRLSELHLVVLNAKHRIGSSGTFHSTLYSFTKHFNIMLPCTHGVFTWYLIFRFSG